MKWLSVPRDQEVKQNSLGEHCRAPLIAEHFRVVVLLQLWWFKDKNKQPTAFLLFQLCWCVQ